MLSVGKAGCGDISTRVQLCVDGGVEDVWRGVILDVPVQVKMFVCRGGGLDASVVVR